MVSADRQRTIENNRSLRTIKNELESLLEKDAITESAYDQINSLLPTESSLSGPSAVPSPAPPKSAAAFNPPTAAEPPPPPAYTQAHHNVPAPVVRKTTPVPAPPPPAEPILCTARALHTYAPTQAGDLAFSQNDLVHVHQYVNQDWWRGSLSSRPSEVGIFPRNYVDVVPDQKPAVGSGAGWAAPEKQPSAATAGYGAPDEGGYPAPPPPGATGSANQQQQEEGGGKGAAMGKKFGKKLGNAAIFGAGATVGSNIVNSIF